MSSQAFQGKQWLAVPREKYWFPCRRCMVPCGSTVRSTLHFSRYQVYKTIFIPKDPYFMLDRQSRMCGPTVRPKISFPVSRTKLKTQNQVYKRFKTLPYFGSVSSCFYCIYVSSCLSLIVSFLRQYGYVRLGRLHGQLPDPLCCQSRSKRWRNLAWPQYKTFSPNMMTFLDNTANPLNITQDDFRLEGISFLQKLTGIYPLFTY